MCECIYAISVGVCPCVQCIVYMYVNSCPLFWSTHCLFNVHARQQMMFSHPFCLCSAIFELVFTDRRTKCLLWLHVISVLHPLRVAVK